MTKVEIAIIAVVVVLIGAIVGVSVLRFQYRRTCLSHGYPQWQAGYCIKRVNQTDVVVPMDSLREEKACDINIHTLC